RHRPRPSATPFPSRRKVGAVRSHPPALPQLSSVEVMGTWGPGPFENDAAAEFLDALRSSPSQVVTKILREIARTPAGKYIDVDDGGAGWAACEMVALAFGYGDANTPNDHILDLAGKLRLKEEHRRLALEALPPIADRDHSELAGPWHEGSEGAQFDAAIEGLRTRLEGASEGPRELVKPKGGDVIALRVSVSSTELVAVQVVNSAEVAVFEGTFAHEGAALD